MSPCIVSNRLKLNIINLVDLDKLWVLPMHGSLPNEDQLKVFQRSPAGTRKVVVATNVAEASVTIPGIVYGNISFVQFVSSLYFINWFDLILLLDIVLFIMLFNSFISW